MLYLYFLQYNVFLALSDDSIERLMQLTEKYVTTRLYKALIGAVNASNEENDLEIQNRFELIHYILYTKSLSSFCPVLIKKSWLSEFVVYLG